MIAHQQDRSYRSLVTRKLEPGENYYLQVEANQPDYEMEVRLFDTVPYDDPRQAVRQGIYYQTAEIAAWLIHRPRNISPHRCVRDATALFGENCMSCHKQSGVWGVADAFRNSYQPIGNEKTNADTEGQCICRVTVAKEAKRWRSRRSSQLLRL